VSEAVEPVSNITQRNGKYFSLCAVFRVARGYFTLCVAHSTTKVVTNAKDTFEQRGTALHSALPFKASLEGYCGFQNF
jgi:hypothetical protein